MPWPFQLSQPLKGATPLLPALLLGAATATTAFGSDTYGHASIVVGFPHGEVVLSKTWESPGRTVVVERTEHREDWDDCDRDEHRHGHRDHRHHGHRVDHHDGHRHHGHGHHAHVHEGHGHRKVVIVERERPVVKKIIVQRDVKVVHRHEPKVVYRHERTPVKKVAIEKRRHEEERPRDREEKRVVHEKIVRVDPPRHGRPDLYPERTDRPDRKPGARR